MAYSIIVGLFLIGLIVSTISEINTDVANGYSLSHAIRNNCLIVGLIVLVLAAGAFQLTTGGSL